MPDNWAKPVEGFYKWEPGEEGPHYVAVPCRDLPSTVDEVQNFFRRNVWHLSSALVHDGQGYAIFSFVEESDAAQCIANFDGEPYDPRDRGKGQHWMMWFRGKVSGRKKRPYDFS